MATIEECRQALTSFAERMAGSGEGAGMDRTLSYHVRDLDVTFSGEVRNGELVDLTLEPRPQAQIRFSSTSDDLLALTNGQLDAGKAFASGRLGVQAGIRDLFKLKSMF